MVSLKLRGWGNKLIKPFIDLCNVGSLDGSSLYRSLMSQRIEMLSVIVPGSVIAWEIQEDCKVVFSYKIIDNLDGVFDLKIIEIIEAAGLLSGTDYRNSLNCNSMIFDHLKDSAIELMEM